MPDLTKHRSSFNPWIMAFPFLPARFEVPSSDGGWIPMRRSWLDALRCRLHRTEADRKLAAGADPDSSECLHLRAAELTAASNREELAAAYERLLVDVTRSPHLDVIGVNWSGVRMAAPRISRLVERLRDDPHVRVQGAARAHLLRSDRHGALYSKDDLELTHEVRATLALL
jgi:hypothetical protein